MKSAMKKTTAPAKLSVPSVESELETMAYHFSEIMAQRTPAHGGDTMDFGCGLGGYGEGCPTVVITGKIRRDAQDGWGAWAQVTLNGKACGNRSGARAEIARLYAPVIAWVASYWATAPAAPVSAPQLAVAV